LGKFWSVLKIGKSCKYFKIIWSILRSLEISYGHLAYFVAIWYIFSPFWYLYQVKSGNPDLSFKNVVTQREAIPFHFISIRNAVH
jgi:hypothetical protein